MPTPRSPLLITYETLKALFLREAISRLALGRSAVWIIVDPVIRLTIMLIIFGVIRVMSIGGINTSVWLMAGLFSYDAFRDTMTSGRNALKGSQILFTYPQIKPLDILLVKAAMEFLLNLLVAIILFSGLRLCGVDVLPANPLMVLAAILGLWLIGLATALVLSVIEHIIPETAKITALIMMPLYMCSGVIFPVSVIPADYREWLMLNPLLHGVETVRLGFSPYYHALPDLSMTYVYSFAVCFLFLGLALQVRFKNRLMTE